MTPEELRDISELVEPGANIAFGRKYTPEQRWRMANELRAMADAEPVAWVYWLPSQDTYDGPNTIRKKSVSFFTEDTRRGYMRQGWQFEPLYTTPQRPQWVGLTKDEIEQASPACRINALTFEDGAIWAESALRAKNGGA